MTELIHLLAGIVGDRHVLAPHDDAAEPFLSEARGDYRSAPECVVLPGTTDEVSRILRICAEAGMSVVPQGGNTGLCGGAVAAQGEVLLSLKRMNRIREVDALNGTLVAEAGCILADIQSAARSVQRLFPVSLGAEGSCMIGGNLATNAGGINVLRYGNTRQQVLGLEVVLGDGRVWDGLNPLYKNNTGYDLKQLFIGSEGTLGIITAASLRLYPQPLQSQSILIGFSNLADCLNLLSLARRDSGDQLSSFELIPAIAMDAAVAHIPGCGNPLQDSHPWYILCQFATSSSVIPLEQMAQSFLESAYESNWLSDAVITTSENQERALWNIREGIVAAQRNLGRSVSHDVSVPVSRVPELITRVIDALTVHAPDVRPYPFGHIGDGNVHMNLLQPKDMDENEFAASKPALRSLVYDIVLELGGSFSAEHGVGLLKRELMDLHKSGIELSMMRAIRTALDPRGLLNPGKVV
jgi:FAD/FMN-containing dehydrogenase